MVLLIKKQFADILFSNSLTTKFLAFSAVESVTSFTRVSGMKTVVKYPVAHIVIPLFASFAIFFVISLYSSCSIAVAKIITD